MEFSGDQGGLPGLNPPLPFLVGTFAGWTTIRPAQAGPILASFATLWRKVHVIAILVQIFMNQNMINWIA